MFEVARQVHPACRAGHSRVLKFGQDFDAALFSRDAPGRWNVLGAQIILPLHLLP